MGGCSSAPTGGGTQGGCCEWGLGVGGLGVGWTVEWKLNRGEKE